MSIYEKLALQRLDAVTRKIFEIEEKIRWEYLIHNYLRDNRKQIDKLEHTLSIHKGIYNILYTTLLGNHNTIL
jgi:hypothetical protein